MADDEFALLHAMLQDEQLARQVADSNLETGVALLLRHSGLILAVMLWRNRTGDALKSAMNGVKDIAEREGLKIVDGRVT